MVKEIETMGEHHDNELDRIRHSAAHVMAEAVLEKFPDGKIAIGPPIEDGFYYDFDLPRPLTPEDLEEIEARMREIIRADFPFTYEEVSADEARQIFSDQPYKLELIEGLEAGKVDEYGEPVAGDVVISTYEHDNFRDLCRGPHVASTGQLNPDAIKLLNTAGAYWRGDEHREMLQRIYGTAWRTANELELYLDRLEEARKRDHRRLGKEMELFSLEPDLLGGGLVLWHPKGAILRHVAESFCKEEHIKHDYDLVYTPHIGRAQLWETSGHLGFYKESMYSPMDVDGLEYYVKPMNCPFHILIYNSRRRSYRELPLRYAEWGTVYRYERPGVLHGLLRVRGFTQDDAHHICSPEQMPDEISFVLDFCLHILRSFGFEDFKAYLSTMPEKCVGEKEQWDAAQDALQRVLEEAELEYEVDEGGGAFYGPKIDLKIRDALGREWQCSTIQFDFNMPERFEMEYIGEDGQPHRPYMVHRALLGSLERFLGVLIEFYGGAFPVWLAPVQAVLIPITDDQVDYCRNVAKELKMAGLRVEVDDSRDRMGNKIRKAQEQKVPYMLVVGKREVAGETVAVRLRTGEDLGPKSVPEFRAMAEAVIESRSKELVAA
jgi:threonyl-tRNA synthetase